MSDVLELPRPWRVLRGFAWSLAEAAGLVMLSVVLCVQTVLVFVTGQAWIYLLQFPVAKLSLALLFACSAPTEHPLVSRLAAEVVSLRHGSTDNPVLHRYFQRATWLWAVIFGVLAIVFPALIATQPIAFFLLISTGIIVVAIGSGAGASALWFFTVLRRSGQRLSFAGR